MARRRSVETAPDVRALLAAHYRDLAAIYSTLEGAPWAGWADALERGEPMEVSGWQVVRWVTGVGVGDLLRLEADGTVVVLRSGPVPPPNRWALRRRPGGQA